LRFENPMMIRFIKWCHSRPCKRILIVCLMAATALVIHGNRVQAASSFYYQGRVIDSLAVSATPSGKCGEKVPSVGFYQQVSLYSIAAGLGFFFLGIFLEKKALKRSCFLLAVIPLAGWLYVHFFVDYDALKRKAFTYDTEAEAALANIAEAQDRYKSEQDTYLGDLQQLHSHMAGSHGVDSCVRILSVEASWAHWTAQARHVSSPNVVTWDSTSGSSLKKG